MTTSQEKELSLQIKGIHDDVDDDQIYDLTRKIVRKLKKVGITSVKAPTGQPTQPGTRGAKGGGDVVTFGVLLIAVLPAVLPKVIDLLTALATDKKDIFEITRKRTYPSHSL